MCPLSIRGAFKPWQIKNASKILKIKINGINSEKGMKLSARTCKIYLSGAYLSGANLDSEIEGSGCAQPTKPCS